MKKTCDARCTIASHDDESIDSREGGHFHSDSAAQNRQFADRLAARWGGRVVQDTRTGSLYVRAGRESKELGYVWAVSERLLD